MKNLSQILSYIIYASILGFIVNSAYICWSHKYYPELFPPYYSAPWYAEIIISGYVALAIILVCIAEKLILKYLIKRKNKKLNNKKETL